MLILPKNFLTLSKHAKSAAVAAGMAYEYTGRIPDLSQIREVTTCSADAYDRLIAEADYTGTIAVPQWVVSQAVSRTAQIIAVMLFLEPRLSADEIGIELNIHKERVLSLIQELRQYLSIERTYRYTILGPAGR